MARSIARPSSVLMVSALVLVLACGPAPAASPTKPAEPAAPAKATQAKPAAAAGEAKAAPVQPGGSKFQELVKAAEGEMAKAGGTLYIASNSPPEDFKPINDAFIKEFPFVKTIKYEYVTGVDAGQAQFLQLQAPNPPTLDVVLPSGELTQEFRKLGLVIPPTVPFKELNEVLPADWGKIDQRGMDPNGYFLTTLASIRGITYNKELIPASKAPKTWNDLLAPEYKGKVTIDPRIKVTAFMHDPSTRDWFLKDYMPKLLPNAIHVRLNEALSGVASGQYLAAHAMNYYQTMKEVAKGAPVAFVIPDPFMVDYTGQLHVYKRTQAPNTATLFITWNASKGQAAVAEKWRELPWYTKGTQYPLLQSGQKMIECHQECQLAEPEYQREWNRLLGLPG